MVPFVFSLNMYPRNSSNDPYPKYVQQVLQLPLSLCMTCRPQNTSASIHHKFCSEYLLLVALFEVLWKCDTLVCLNCARQRLWHPLRTKICCWDTNLVTRLLDCFCQHILRHLFPRHLAIDQADIEMILQGLYFQTLQFYNVSDSVSYQTSLVCYHQLVLLSNFKLMRK